MKFTPTAIEGVKIIEPETVDDSRGRIARVFCTKEFLEAGLELTNVQAAISHNSIKATLRGLHFIPEEEGEAKLVRCFAGSIFDVAVDLRPASATFGTWIGLTMSAGDLRALYIPRGCAHGFVTLSDESDVFYQFSQAHRPGLEQGVRWDDPTLGISWPVQPAIISERDRGLPLLDRACLPARGASRSGP